MSYHLNPYAKPFTPIYDLTLISFIPIIAYVPLYNLQGQMRCSYGYTYNNYKLNGYSPIITYIPYYSSKLNLNQKIFDDFGPIINNNVNKTLYY